MKQHRVFLLWLVVCSTLCASEPTGRYKIIVDQLRAIESQAPSFTSVFSIGPNDDGTEIYAMRVSTTPKVIDPHKIGHVVVSTHHGNESHAPLFTMAYLRSLVMRYQSQELWRVGLADIEWTILPVLNISGYNANERHEHGVDPNRDYPGPCPSNYWRLKSIRNLRDFLERRIFSGSVTVHGYDGSLTYPWGMYANEYRTLDDNLYDSIFAKAAQLNHYKSGNGALLIYPANGCYEDFVYWKHGLWSLLLELLDGSENDIRLTVKAIASFFDQLSSSPSNKNQFLHQCTRSQGPDLRIE